ncbi:Ger(x)C family spore germination protein [Cytobacillus dafuensis]|uniref:Ger(X)C family spore germination protein n=1 Tax=Cytobacillus dafuensis TaxID=1742359 RepID=A0A5B8Z585_CYTDA|nr:Ger(x)C family spore germination protein [Cytobacillus dafuensis]QED46749.1 Ger(x)C family spore germination protein [Cytobacillus dafuensis]
MKKDYERRFKLILLFFCLLFILTGCFSSEEIEDRAFNIGVAIDKVDDDAKEMDSQKRGATYEKKNVLKVTFQYMNTVSAKPEAKGGGKKQYINVSEIGDSNHQMIREVALKQENPIMFHHTKVIIINANVLKVNKMTEVLDLYLRDNELRPTCLLLVSSGPAKDALETKLPEIIPSFRLIGIIDNDYRSNKILPPMPLAKLEGKMHSGSSYLLQNVFSDHGDIKFSGGVIIDGKTNLLRGKITEDEVTGINMITGETKGGLIKAREEKSGKVIIYEIKSLKTKIIPHVNRNKISFDIKIKSEGTLTETWGIPKESEKAFIKNAEKLIEQQTRKIIKKTLNTTQKKYRVDVADFGNQLSISHPHIWKKVKNNWDSTFSEIPINYSIQIKINDYGSRSLK